MKYKELKGNIKTLNKEYKLKMIKYAKDYDSLIENSLNVTNALRNIINKKKNKIIQKWAFNQQRLIF